MAKLTPIPTKMVSIKIEDNVKSKIFNWTFALLYFLYFLVFAGVSIVDVKYVHILTFIIHFGICVFLLWRFNPYIDHVLRPYDSDIIFSSAIILLINTLSTQFGTGYISNIVAYFQESLQTDISEVFRL